MTVRISRTLLHNIVADVRQDPNHERCGLLLGVQEQEITSFQSVPNVHPETGRHFELDPIYLIDAMKKTRLGADAVIGHYHSHPNGRAIPSQEDADQAIADDRLWLIIGADDVRLWQSVEQGEHLGRFNPLNLIVTP